tara:strand:- start:2051 stop:2308 length:258 start_codon:yes stop_codon:yes gene_type:complete
MNKKAYISITILIGFVIGIFIIQPLGISFFMYDNYEGLSSWWSIVKDVFKQIMNFGDFTQIFKNILFGVLGISIALMYYLGLKKK